MSARTRYLLDKVIVRYTLDGMLSLSLGRDPTDPQAAAIRLFQSATTQPVELFIAPASAQILHRLRTSPRVAPLIQLFVQRTQIAVPTRYSPAGLAGYVSLAFRQKTRGCLPWAVSAPTAHALFWECIASSPMITRW